MPRIAELAKRIEEYAKEGAEDKLVKSLEDAEKVMRRIERVADAVDKMLLGGELWEAMSICDVEGFEQAPPKTYGCYIH